MSTRFLLACPACEVGSLVALETRNVSGINRRRRQCKECGHRVTTYEIPQETYQELRTAADTLARVQRALYPSGSPTPESEPLPCHSCHFVASGACSFGYPEAFTTDAIGCSQYRSLSD